MKKIGSEVIAHSECVITGSKIITVEIIAPKFLNSEILTHRVFSRNASSSRAIPISTTISNITSDPYIPKDIRVNQRGMQGFEKLDESLRSIFQEQCIQLANINATYVDSWRKQFNIHKQHLNRYLEPWIFQKLVITSTEWENWFHLRNHPMADPAIQELAIQMLECIEDSTPALLFDNDWHTPYVDNEEYFNQPLQDSLKMSTARCARTSYDNHNGSRSTVDKDKKLFDQLVTRPYKDDVINLTEKDPRHESPVEHQAKPMKRIKAIQEKYLNPEKWENGVTHMDKEGNYWSNNFKGFIQHRAIL